MTGKCVAKGGLYNLTVKVKDTDLTFLILCSRKIG